MPLTSTTGYIRHHVFPAMWSILPERFASPEANALLLAIGMQESGRFEHRLLRAGVDLDSSSRGPREFQPEQNGGLT